MRFHSGTVLALMLLGAAAAGCDEKISSLAGPTPNLEPTFSSIQHEIFESPDPSGRVACTTCHSSNGRVPAGGMSLDHDLAYANLVNVAAREKPTAIRVIPGDADNSYLIHKVLGLPDITGRRMPFNGPPFLTDGQILIMRRWIQLGAPNN